MKSDILADYYGSMLEQNHFRAIPCPDKFSPAGQCWEISLLWAAAATGSTPERICSTSRSTTFLS